MGMASPPKRGEASTDGEDSTKSDRWVPRGDPRISNTLLSSLLYWSNLCSRNHETQSHETAPTEPNVDSDPHPWRAGTILGVDSFSFPNPRNAPSQPKAGHCVCGDITDNTCVGSVSSHLPGTNIGASHEIKPCPNIPTRSKLSPIAGHPRQLPHLHHGFRCCFRFQHSVPTR